MARFRGTVEGGRSQASRLGHTTTGLHTTANGWRSGVEVIAHPTTDELDTFLIYATGGSNGGQRHLLGSVYKDDAGHLHFSLEVQPGNDLQLD